MVALCRDAPSRSGSPPASSKSSRVPCISNRSATPVPKTCSGAKPSNSTTARSSRSSRPHSARDRCRRVHRQRDLPAGGALRREAPGAPRPRRESGLSRSSASCATCVRAATSCPSSPTCATATRWRVCSRSTARDRVSRRRPQARPYMEAFPAEAVKNKSAAPQVSPPRQRRGTARRHDLDRQGGGAREASWVPASAWPNTRWRRCNRPVRRPADLAVRFGNVLACRGSVVPHLHGADSRRRSRHRDAPEDARGIS